MVEGGCEEYFPLLLILLPLLPDGIGIEGVATLI
jgi:hypothetical protein